MCRRPDLLLSKFRKILGDLSHFSVIFIITLGKPCLDTISREPFDILQTVLDRCLNDLINF